MVRCPRCGLRLRDAQPVCPSHGPPAVEPAAPGAPPAETAPHEDAVALARALEARGYRVDRLLGRGGFGAVYGATRVGDGLRVAVKVALPEPRAAADSLEREAIALEVVGPPYAPVVHERGLFGEQYGVVLEYIEAPTLADRLVAEAGAMPLERFVPCARALLRAVQAIHGRSIVHRDLKPENIFLIGGGAPHADGGGSTELFAKIIDFGLAKDASDAPPGRESSQDDAMGTAEYMSPEQCEGRADTDRRSDVYSVGVLFYEMLAGAPPFWGKAADVREAQRSRRPPPLPASVRCPAELEDVVRRCLAKDRVRRFDDVSALGAAFDHAIDAAKERLAATATAPLPAPIEGAAPPPRAAAPAREKRAMGLLFFDSRGPLGSIQTLLTSSGGQLVQTNGSQYVAAFGHDVGDNPARTAVAAGKRLLSSGICERALVDVATVSVQVRPGGPNRIFSAVFSKKDRFPLATDPAGVSLTTAAVEVVPDLSVAPIPDREGRFRLDLERGAREETTRHGSYGGATFGRDALLAELVDVARTALERSEPTLATIVGEAGYGKTHLAEALAHRMARVSAACEVVVLTAQQVMLGAQPQTLPDLLRALGDVPSCAPPDGGRSLWIDRLGTALGEQVWPAASFVLSWIAADHPDLRRLAAAPGALRLATSRAAGELLRRRATARPLAVVVDDAHLADDATLDALEFATLREDRARLFVLATVRPAFRQGRPMWATRAAHGPTSTLGPLEMPAAIDLVRSLLQVESAPSVALARLAERAEGVPRLIVELVRGLKRDGLVRRTERGTGYYLATDELDKLPDLPLLQWNARREVEMLPVQLAGHARLASVLGTRFTVAEVEGLIRVLEKDEPLDDVQLDAEVGIQRLIDARLLVRHRTGAIDFRSPLMRDTIYQLLPEDRRQRFHRAAFEMYRTTADPSVEQLLPRLALHAARSGEKEEAARAYLELAERAAETHGYLEAETAFGGALENLGGDDPRVIRAARGRGLMRFRLGRLEDALKDLENARTRANAHGSTEDEVEILLDQATVRDWTREYPLAAELVKSAEALAKAPTPLTTARLMTARCRVHYRQLDPEACAAVGLEAARIAESLGGSGYESMVIALLMVAPSFATLGRLDEAERVFEKLLAVAEPRGDMMHVASALNNRVFMWFARENVDRCVADLTASVKISREIGASFMEFTAVQNMAEIAYTIERLDECTEHAQRAIELAIQLCGEQSGELSGRELLLARVALYRSDIAEARRLVERIHARCASSTDGAGLGPSDAMILSAVELGCRNATEEQWDALLARAAEIGLGTLEDVEVLEAAALASARAGRHAEAKVRFGRVLELCKTKPNLLSSRVQRKFEALCGAGAERLRS